MEHGVDRALTIQHSQFLQSVLKDFLNLSRVGDTSKLDKGIAGSTFCVLSKVVR